MTLVQPSDGSTAFLLCLFTTLEESKDEIVKLYGLRWNIETDLLSLKKTLRIAQLTCTTPDMIDKEIEVAIMSYNLARAVIYQAAQQAGVAPRTFSFTRVRNIIINVYGPKIAAAKNEQEANELIALMFHYVGQAKLYMRKRRSCPRETWHSSKPFPRRKAQS